jgi:hypothetical protein
MEINFYIILEKTICLQNKEISELCIDKLLMYFKGDPPWCRYVFICYVLKDWWWLLLVLLDYNTLITIVLDIVPRSIFKQSKFNNFLCTFQQLNRIYLSFSSLCKFPTFSMYKSLIHFSNGRYCYRAINLKIENIWHC